MSELGAFVDPQIVYEFEDGHKVAYINCQEDLATLGNLMGHCAGSQRVWALEEKVWYFFTILDQQGFAHNTIHMKQASWMGKGHPRDREPGTGPIGRCDAYDSAVERGEQEQSLEQQYGFRIPNRGNCPVGVDRAVWNEYVRTHKAMCDNFKKNVGSIKIVGRRVKFDGKYLIVLSANGRYGSDGDKYRRMVGEWLNSMNRKQVAA